MKIFNWLIGLGLIVILGGIIYYYTPQSYIHAFQEWRASWFAKTTTSVSQGNPSQNPCSSRYASASMRKIAVMLPANGELSEEITFTAPAGKCYWFEGPETAEVWFNDGSHGLISKQYPPKIPKLRFSNLSGGVVNILIER